MKKALAIVIILSMAIGNAFAQQLFKVNIIVGDSVTGMLLNGTTIKEKETGKLYTTGPNGNVAIYTANFPVSLLFSNIGYENKTVIIENDFQEYSVQMNPVSSELKSVTIQTPKPQKVIQDMPFFIADYEIRNDSIFFIGYRNKLKSKSYLVIANLKGDTLTAKKIENAEKLYKDCFENIHVICSNIAVQVFVGSSGIEFLYPVDREEFEKAFEPITAYHDEVFFVNSHSCNDQVLNYYAFDINEKVLNPMLTISNSRNIFMLRDYARLASSADFSAADARFEKMCFYKPVYAPLFCNRDTIYIFNTQDSVIELFSMNREKVSSVQLSKEFYKNNKEQIISDPVNNTYYILKVKSGLCILDQIDPVTAKIVQSVKIPDLPFVQKISVWNNNFYFLYSDFSHMGYKKLYVLKN